MTITELIGRLLAELVRHGNVIVEMHDYECGGEASVTEIVSYEATDELLGRVVLY